MAYFLPSFWSQSWDLVGDSASRLGDRPWSGVSGCVMLSKIFWLSTLTEKLINVCERNSIGKHVKTYFISTSYSPLWGRHTYLCTSSVARSYITTALQPASLARGLAVIMDSLVPRFWYHIRGLLVDSSVRLCAWTRARNIYFFGIWKTYFKQNV